MEENNGFIFTKKNFSIMGVGVALIIIGFVLMSGGGSEDPNVFNADEIFSPIRITVAPITVLLGYLVIGYGIMKKTIE